MRTSTVRTGRVDEGLGAEARVDDWGVRAGGGAVAGVRWRSFARRALFRVRRHYGVLLLSRLRVMYWRLLGMRIGEGTRVSSMTVTWPHRVVLGRRCSLEQGIYFNAAGGYREEAGIEIGDGTFVGNGCEFNVVRRVRIGTGCLIAAGCRFVDHNHGTAAGRPMMEQPETSAEIVVGSDVWIGAQCVILKGVTIGEGAVLAAGSVLTKSVPPNAIYGGVPARLLRQRS